MHVELSTDLLKFAYAQGYFPMPDPQTEDILWYSPDPRAIMPLDKFRVSRSLQRSLYNRGYTVTFDKAFSKVMEGCADRKETWINDEFKRAYGRMHSEGYAHSVEVWLGEALVGGVYGVSLHGAFFAESKFHRATDASKVALFHLIDRMRLQGMLLLEVQFMTPHLKSLGAIEVPADKYKELLGEALASRARF